MSKLSTCSACRGFVPHEAAACPHCGGAVSSPLKRGVMAALAGVAIPMTLMACYGAGPYDENALCRSVNADGGVEDRCGFTDGGADAGPVEPLPDAGAADGG